MSSTRLPGKSLADVGGEPSLALMLRRLGRAETLGRTLVATSTDAGDDAVAELAEALGCYVHRGPRDDVLGRFAEAAGDHAGPVVRLTADCPLIDPGVVDDVVRLFESEPAAVYASNVEPRTFPKGLDTEVIAADALAAAAAEATSPDEREHVTLMIRRRPGRFPRVNLEGDQDLGELRWTIDYPGDLEFVRKVVERLGERRYQAELQEVLEAVRRPPSLAEYEGRRA